ncbi:RNA-directed DNA polymerase, eukaryota [Tanacetum coccineum]
MAPLPRRVDFEKAYDSVRWDFLDDVLGKFGFGDKWRKWIRCCLHSSKGSIIINGSPTKEFYFGKGLKQGDPLSPFLFLLIMESLHISFQRVVDAGLFNGIKIGGSVNLSHMFYADDAVFVGEWSESNISSLIHVLECFHKVSGLKINMSKSKIMGFEVDSDRVSHAAAKLGCLLLKTPFVYLDPMWGYLQELFLFWNRFRGKVLNGHEISMLVGNLLGSWKTVLAALKSWGHWSRVKDSGMRDIDGAPKKKGKDKWKWSGNKSGEYSVSSARYLIDTKLLPKGNMVTRWIRYVPIKVNILAWKRFWQSDFTLIVDGGMFLTLTLTRTTIGEFGLIPLNCQRRIKTCLKVFSTLLGGFFGISGIRRCSKARLN